MCSWGGLLRGCYGCVGFSGDSGAKISGEGLVDLPFGLEPEIDFLTGWSTGLEPEMIGRVTDLPDPGWRQRGLGLMHDVLLFALSRSCIGGGASGNIGASVNRSLISLRMC